MGTRRWKDVDGVRYTGHLDRSGVYIRIGDTVSFKRKVRAGYCYPGYTETVTAKVIGCGTIVKSLYNGKVKELSYINVRYNPEKNKYCSSNYSRIYKTENVTVLTDAR